MSVPQFTLDDYEKTFADRHLLHGVVAKWAKARPETAAMVSAEGDRTVSWSEFDRTTTALARELLRLGFAKGDFLVTLLPFSVDHVLLEYGVLQNWRDCCAARSALDRCRDAFGRWRFCGRAGLPVWE